MIGNLLSDTGSESDNRRGKNRNGKITLKFSVNLDTYLVGNTNLGKTAYKKKKEEHSLLQTMLQMKQLAYWHLLESQILVRKKKIYIKSQYLQCRRGNRKVVELKGKQEVSRLTTFFSESPALG